MNTKRFVLGFILSILNFSQISSYHYPWTRPGGTIVVTDPSTAKQIAEDQRNAAIINNVFGTVRDIAVISAQNKNTRRIKSRAEKREYLKELNRDLDEAIENEDLEEAKRIRKEIKYLRRRL